MEPAPNKQPRVARYENSPVTPWRNGRGTTRLLRPAGVGSQEWWVSIADLNTTGPFSTFPAIERVFTPLGASVELTIDGLRHSVPARCPIQFSGEAAVSLGLPEGPTVAVNVFAARSSCSLDVRVCQVRGSMNPCGALVLIEGLARLADGRHLGALDLVEGPAEVDGTILAINVRTFTKTAGEDGTGTH